LTDAHHLAVVGRGFAWLGNAALVAALPPARQDPEPRRPTVPAGPAVQESIGGKAAQTTTFADMLRSPFDEILLEWHLQGELAKVGVDGAVTRFGAIGAWLDIEPSPDAQLILTTEVHRPFSYLAPGNDAVPCGPCNSSLASRRIGMPTPATRRRELRRRAVACSTYRRTAARYSFSAPARAPRATDLSSTVSTCARAPACGDRRRLSSSNRSNCSTSRALRR
jgi:hypothetical protein